MANMEIYKPECQVAKLGKKPCDSRATFIARGANQELLCCGAHVKTALYELTVAENAAKKNVETKAARS